MQPKQKSTMPNEIQLKKSYRYYLLNRFFLVSRIIVCIYYNSSVAVIFTANFTAQINLCLFTHIKHNVYSQLIHHHCSNNNKLCFTLKSLVTVYILTNLLCSISLFSIVLLHFYNIHSGENIYVSLKSIFLSGVICIVLKTIRENCNSFIC